MAINEKILMPFLIELNSQKPISGTKELIDVNIKKLSPLDHILRFKGRQTPLKYVAQESLWYNSCDLNIKGWVDNLCPTFITKIGKE